MCWSEGATLAMVGIGAAAAGITARRGEPVAIPATLAFFAVMEALQWVGYQSVDRCDLGGNRWATILSYIHISLQPIFINAFGMAICAPMLSAKARRRVFLAAGAVSALLLFRMVAVEAIGPCLPGSTLCGPGWCTLTGNWHITWDMPLNNLFGWLSGGVFGGWAAFPDYMLAVFVLPLFYGAWRLVLVHFALGPFLAYVLTDNPNEFPAIWCLFSVGLVLVALSPLVRRTIAPDAVRSA